ncbi:MAG: hypothetical protein Q4D79_04735 [Propionibacteriaceae bacterium]|nr:hypothetical protein [Propionibacteriaceae bacterium]
MSLQEGRPRKAPSRANSVLAMSGAHSPTPGEPDIGGLDSPFQVAPALSSSAATTTLTFFALPYPAAGLAH